MHKRFLFLVFAILLVFAGCQSAGYHEIFKLGEELSPLSFNLTDQQAFNLSVKLKYDFNIASSTTAVEVFLISPTGRRYSDRIRLNKKSGLAGTKEKVIQIRDVAGEEGTWTLKLGPAPSGFTYRQAIIDLYHQK